MIRMNYKRASLVAPYIERFVEDRRASGYDYKENEYLLNRFDAYCVDNGLKTVEISREFLAGWMQKKDTEGASSLKRRIGAVRQLLLFMEGLGVKVYIPSITISVQQPIPHIFDLDELKEFFYQLDHYKPKVSRKSENRIQKEYCLIFRVYCCCGMRNSEATLLRTENINLDTGVITIIDGKKKKDRLVYIPDCLLEDCNRYYEWLCSTLGFIPEWFFPGKDPNNHMLNTSLDRAFNRFWNKTSYAKQNNKPTIHDFRFTFVVHRLNSWAEQNIDLNVMLPYLSKYLGHTSVTETLYYYFLVDEAYRTIKSKDLISNKIIPEASDEQYDFF